MRRTGHTVTRRGHEHGLAKLIEEGPYFTDGVGLFRLAGVVSGSSGPKLVQLEDCRTLDVSEYTEEEVLPLDLVPVKARPVGEGAEGASRGTSSTGAGLERTSPDETPPSSTLRTGP